jgi:oxygen-independent coproporphyrinogen-3 oxidase
MVRSTLTANNCASEVFKDGRLLNAYTLPLSGDLPIKRSLMISLFYALREAVPANVPWGTLTGIRPSKLARQWLAEGISDDDVIKTLTGTYLCSENKARLALVVARSENQLAETAAAKAASQSSFYEGTAPVPMGLYISIPYCPSRCLYCSFNTCVKPAKDETLRRYLDVLLDECVKTYRIARGIRGIFSSIYIGGGTPTVLNEGMLDTLLSGIAGSFGPLITSAEYTVEAGRPDSLTPGKLRILKSYGVTRISINPQTLNDRTLNLIGRDHTAKDFFAAVEMARSVGFNHINADVIAGLPGEEPEDMRRTMNGLMAIVPENITVHTLAVKRASRLNEYLSEYPLPGAADTEAMLAIAEEACVIAGFAPYYLYRQKNAVGLFENTGYSLPGYECLYNIAMMAETQTVLAAGAGSVTKYVDGTRIERVFHPKNADIYMERYGNNK